MRWLALACCLAQPAAADCRLALVLALDVSSSVDAAEDMLQRHGLAAALRAPAVQAAALAGAPVALASYEWSGRYNQRLLVDWTLIETRADLLGVAAALDASRRGHDDFPTALGHALGYGAGLMARAPDCHERTIDVSGDGVNNDGFGPALAYANFPFDGVVVNGLVVNGADFEAEVNLVRFYRDEVLHGPGAFVEIAQGFEDYERAMRRKLERELRPRAVGAGPSVPGRDGRG